MTDSPKTKDGDVIIRCFADKPTPHTVSVVRKDSDLAGDSPEIVGGRIEAIIRANRVRGEAGRVYLHEDDHWLDITEGEARADQVVEAVMKNQDRRIGSLMDKASDTKH